MSSTTLSTVYAAAVHLLVLVAVVVLMAMGKLDVTAGLGLLGSLSIGGLSGFAIGLPVTPPGTGSVLTVPSEPKPPAPPAP